MIRPRWTPQSTTTILAAATMTALYLCGALPAWAQKGYLLEETTAIAGRAADFAAAQKDYCAVVLRGGAPQCVVLGPTTFSPSTLFFTLLGFSSFHHYDEGTYTSRGETPEQAAELNRRRGPTVAANRESALRQHAEASYGELGGAPLVRVTDFTIRPGTQSTLLAYMRKVALPAARHAGLRSSVLYQVVAGGDTNRYLLLQEMQNFAQMDAIAPLGDAAAGPGDGVAGCIVQSRTTVMRLLERDVAR